METEGSWKCPPPVPILSYTKPVYALNPTSWRSILILSSHLCLFLLSGLFPSGFSTKTLYAHLISSICATCPAHFFHLGLITRIIFGVEYKPLCSSLCSCLHSSVTSSLWGQHTLLSTLFSNTLSLRSSLNVSDHVSHPYTTTDKIIFLCILIFIYLHSKLEDKRFCTERWQDFLEVNLHLISPWIEIPFVRVVPKYLNCSGLSKELLSIFV